ncbi:carbohydrate ABC transporter permease [Propioniciclava coleopterorum]|uniref:carbohydrate ABC transporter permease n=1 Tax=Propioniciclava coleopterorum TaxID=2714937 RepID=UPI00198064EF|nr:carbohydrate ABC transporter permease [Propioniciclava coleopterorum]
MSIQTDVTVIEPVTTPRRARGQRVRSVRSQNVAKRAVFYLFMAVATCIVLYPAAWMLMSSFKPSDQIVGNVSLIPDPFTLANYAKALTGIAGVSFWTFFTNSLILATLSVLGSCSRRPWRPTPSRAAGSPGARCGSRS